MVEVSRVTGLEESKACPLQPLLGDDIDGLAVHSSWAVPLHVKRSAFSYQNWQPGLLAL